jgi:hypothetical protein
VDPEFCRAIAAETSVTNGASDPDVMQHEAERLRQLRDAAPAELRADVELVANAMLASRPAVDQLSKLSAEQPAEGRSDAQAADQMAAQMLAMASSMRALQNPAFQEALARLSAYAEQRCG